MHALPPFQPCLLWRLGLTTHHVHGSTSVCAGLRPWQVGPRPRCVVLSMHARHGPCWPPINDGVRAAGGAAWAAGMLTSLASREHEVAGA